MVFNAAFALFFCHFIAAFFFNQFIIQRFADGLYMKCVFFWLPQYLAGVFIAYTRQVIFVDGIYVDVSLNAKEFYYRSVCFYVVVVTHRNRPRRGECSILISCKFSVEKSQLHFVLSWDECQSVRTSNCIFRKPLQQFFFFWRVSIQRMYCIRCKIKYLIVIELENGAHHRLDNSV